jgi:hypothetical protein
VFALWPLGRGAELPATFAEAEATARQLGDPLILSQALQILAFVQSGAGARPDVVDAFADEALFWARASDDAWEIACASHASTRGASTVAELRRRVDRAASLLTDVGNVFHLADMLASGAYTALNAGRHRDAKDLVERAIPVARELRDPFLWMILHGNLGLAALLASDTDAAQDAFREELTLCRELGVRPVASEGLRGLAAVAAVRGDARRAARLVGAAAAHRYGFPHKPIDARLDAAFFDVARTRCGADAWDATAREGAKLGFEDAIAYALEEPPAQVRPHHAVT